MKVNVKLSLPILAFEDENPPAQILQSLFVIIRSESTLRVGHVFLILFSVLIKIRQEGAYLLETGVQGPEEENSCFSRVYRPKDLVDVDVVLRFFAFYLPVFEHLNQHAVLILCIRIRCLPRPLIHCCLKGDNLFVKIIDRRDIGLIICLIGFNWFILLSISVYIDIFLCHRFLQVARPLDWRI